MKTTRKALALILGMMLLISMSAMTAFAADEYGEDYGGTEYTVKIYSGKSGTFGDGSTEKEYTGLKYGDKIRLDINSEEMKPELTGSASGKYYPRGFKIAGHDNDEISRMNLVSYEYTVTSDESFSIAYGMKGAMVKYTVNYVDEDGNTLIPSEEFYGMPGDKPVVSYRYVEGYTPQAYNLAKTLTDNEGENVFTFTYTRGETNEGDNGDDDNDNDNDNGGAGANNANGNGGNANGAGNANAAGNGAAGANNAGDGTNIGDNATPTTDNAGVVDLDNGDVPMSEPDSAETTETEKQLSLSKIIAGLCAVLLIAGLIAVLLLRRRSDEYEDDDEEEDDSRAKTADLGHQPGQQE